MKTNLLSTLGRYIFNALCSGSYLVVLSGNKITAIAGESSTGKTYFALAVVKNFLEQNPTGGVVYFDTESAITKSLLTDRAVDCPSCPCDQRCDHRRLPFPGTEDR